MLTLYPSLLRLAMLPATHPTVEQAFDMSKFEHTMSMYTRTLQESQTFRDEFHPATIESLIIALMLLFGFNVIIGNHMSCLRYLRYVRAVLQTYPIWYVFQVRNVSKHRLCGRP